jgi:hypothetical protein
MRDGMINKAGCFPIAMSEVALEPVVPFFHSITKPKIFIAGSATRGLDDGKKRDCQREFEIESPSSPS